MAGAGLRKSRRVSSRRLFLERAFRTLRYLSSSERTRRAESHSPSEQKQLRSSSLRGSSPPRRGRLRPARWRARVHPRLRARLPLGSMEREVTAEKCDLSTAAHARVVRSQTRTCESSLPVKSRSFAASGWKITVCTGASCPLKECVQ